MSEVMNDSAIKLFGKTIGVMPDKLLSCMKASEQITQSTSATSNSQDSKNASIEESTGNMNSYNSYINPPTELETSTEAPTSSDITDHPNTPPPVDKDEDEEPSDEKTLKKPDKILNCPRCNSSDTKFCYYNNYNVGQPRHFCKNCQRYWTSGGTMRNVPVGSGRRKNKASTTAVFPDYQQECAKPNGFLVFGSGNYPPDEVHDRSSGSSSNSNEKAQESGFRNFQEMSTLQVPCYPMPHNGFPMAFYPAGAYWGSAVASPWNLPWASATSPGSTTLGKHSRDETIIRPDENCSEKVMSRERGVLVPKTLRIHDPSEAAKSSIWTTLGIKNERIGSNNGRSLFKAFQSKGDRVSSNIDHATMVLQSNPAALLRSVNFHESA